MFNMQTDETNTSDRTTIDTYFEEPIKRCISNKFVIIQFSFSQLNTVQLKTDEYM